MRKLITTCVLLATINAGAETLTDTLETVCLTEVSVHSQPKEQGLLRQQTASTTLLDSRQLENAQTTSLKGISTLTPNFFMPDYGSRLTSAIYIRGIGSRSGAPAVTLYVDNIPYSDKSAFDFRFDAVERIDVLRGPQGALYGRNTMGGLIKLHTRNPMDHPGSEIKLGYTSHTNGRYISANHHQRISDKFAYSCGGYYEGAQGFFRNDITGKRVDSSNGGGVRMRGIYKPSERFSLDMNLGYEYSKEGAYPYFLHGKIQNNLESTYRRQVVNMGANAQWNFNKVVLNSVTGFQDIGDRMFMDQDFTHANIYSLEQKQKINTISEELLLKNKAQGRWQWLTGASLSHQLLQTEAPVIFYEDGVQWLGTAVNAYMPNVTTIPSLSGMGFQSMAVNFRDQRFNLGGTFDTPVLNAAVFHQSTLLLTDRLSVAVGLRLDYEHNAIDYLAPAVVNYGFQMENPSPMFNVNLQDLTARLLYDGEMKRDYLRVLPKLSVKYDLAHRSNIYMTIAKGMRSGGYNIQMFSDLLQGTLQADMMQGIKEGVRDFMTSKGAPAVVADKVYNTMDANMPQLVTPDPRQIAYKPEYSWNYEVGTHLNLADGRLLLDAAAFYIHTRDQQIMRFANSGLGRMMVNAGKSESFGGEISVRWKPIRQLALTGNYGYTHAQFTDYDMGGSVDYSGNYIPFMPMHSVGADADYRFLVAGHTAFIGVNYSGAGRIYWTEDNTAHQSYYSLLGARIGINIKPVEITVWGKNLTNTRYNTFYFISMGNALEQHGKPLHVGIDVKVKF